MTLKDADKLLEIWNHLSDKEKLEFDKVIMSEPTIKAIIITNEKKHVSNFDFEDFEDFKEID